MAMNPLPPQAYTKETLAKAYAWLQHQNESIKEIATHPDVLVSLYLKAKLNGHEALERPSIQNFRNELKNLSGLLGELEGQSASHAAGHTPQQQQQKQPPQQQPPQQSPHRPQFPGQQQQQQASAVPPSSISALASSSAVSVSGFMASTGVSHQSQSPDQAPLPLPPQPTSPPLQTSSPAGASMASPSHSSPHVSPVHSARESGAAQASFASALGAAALGGGGASYTRYGGGSAGPGKTPSRSGGPQAPGFELDVKTWQMIKDMRAEMNLSHESEALRLLVSVGYKRLKSL